MIVKLVYTDLKTQTSCNQCTDKAFYGYGYENKTNTCCLAYHPLPCLLLNFIL